MAPSDKTTNSQRTAKSLKSSGTGKKKKKKITIRMESLALHNLSQLADADGGPIVVRDYPEGCSRLPWSSPSRKDSVTSTRRTRRRLVTDTNSDSDGSPNSSDHASISRRETQLHLSEHQPAAADYVLPAPVHPAEEDDELLILPPNAVVEATPQTPPAAHLTPPEAPRDEPNQYFPFLWYSFSVHEALNIASGMTPPLPFTAEYLVSKGTPET